MYNCSVWGAIIARMSHFTVSLDGKGLKFPILVFDADTHRNNVPVKSVLTYDIYEIVFIDCVRHTVIIAEHTFDCN